MAHTPPQFRRMLSVFQGLQPPICDRSDSSPLDNLTQTPTATRLSQIFAALPCPPAMDQRLDLNSAPFSLENQLQGTRAEDALDWSELASEGCSRSREPSLPASLSVGAQVSKPETPVQTWPEVDFSTSASCNCCHAEGHRDSPQISRMGSTVSYSPSPPASWPNVNFEISSVCDCKADEASDQMHHSNGHDDAYYDNYNHAYSHEPFVPAHSDFSPPCQTGHPVPFNMTSVRADERIYAPTRITPISLNPVSSFEAQEMINRFLDKHDERTRMTGGDFAIAGQLRELERSLKEGGKKKKDKERK